ncbi:Crp/Fnr family transcriptional regulator [Chryseobacterium gossypii]|uniref:Crp/Fnr family transcriptional regulator n=1 Tax=Chryseobacterium gossypii TaxID=3231602 RepID=UPI0035239D82
MATISERYLNTAGAEVKEYNAKEFIFHEGTQPLFYYQITKGKVKLNNYNKDGKEFIQSILFEGQSFGEAMLFSNKPYPIDAVALTRCTVLRLSKSRFLNLLRSYPHLYFNVCKGLSDCLYYQYVMLQKNSSQRPKDRLMGIMVYLKNSQKEQAPFSFKIPFTRQQLASLTGLCVETAIRVIKTMEKDKIVRIKDHKIFF